MYTEGSFKMRNIFQSLGKPIFLILFLIGFLGSNCNRTGGGDSTNMEQVLLEQEEKTTAREQAVEEAQRKVEATRQAGDATQAAEVEKRQREAEAKKQRQIQAALQIAASKVLKANKALERVIAVKEQFEGTNYVHLPFSDLERAVNTATVKANKAFAEAAKIKEVSAVYDKGEEVALAANRAEKQVQLAEEFENHFQSHFTFHSHEKALFPSSSDRTEDEQFEKECDNFKKEFALSKPAGVPLVADFLISSYPGCDLAQVTRGESSHYNCFCRYGYKKLFYKR